MGATVAGAVGITAASVGLGATAFAVASTAVVGAVVGGVTAAVSGGNILKGALVGGVIGAVGGAAGAALGVGVNGAAAGTAGATGAASSVAVPTASEMLWAGAAESAFPSVIGSTMTEGAVAGGGAAASGAAAGGSGLFSTSANGMLLKAGLDAASGMAKGYGAADAAEEQRDWQAQQRKVTPVDNEKKMGIITKRDIPEMTTADKQSMSYRVFQKPLEIPAPGATA